MAFTDRLLFLLYLLAVGCSCFAQVKIADDLPELSRNEPVMLCSPAKLVTSDVKWSHFYQDPTPEPWLRAHFVITVPPVSKPWRIEILDDTGTAIQVVRSADVEPQSGSFWTDIIEGGQFEFRVVSDEDLNGYQFCLESINLPKAGPHIESFIHHKDDREDLGRDYPPDNRYRRYGRSVAMVRFQEWPSGKETNCTGVLLAPTIIATNNHCVGVPQQIATARAIFGYESGSNDVVPIKVVGLLHTSSLLDYSLLRIEALSSPHVAQIGLTGLAANRRLIMIQHPANSTKQIAVKKCKVQAASTVDRFSDFYHLCDSSDGSSGSPAMDERSGVVYGLHHLGEPEVKGGDYHNLAIKIADIFKDLEESHNQPLLAEIQEAQGHLSAAKQ